MIKKVVVELSVGLLRLWHYCLAPLFGPRCRFEPSCSQYAIEALRKYGFFRGWWFAAIRVARCHPYCEGGYDPVP